MNEKMKQLLCGIIKCYYNAARNFRGNASNTGVGKKPSVLQLAILKQYFINSNMVLDFSFLSVTFN